MDRLARDAIEFINRVPADIRNIHEAKARSWFAHFLLCLVIWRFYKSRNWLLFNPQDADIG